MNSIAGGNLADIRDANRLNQFESDHFFARLLELHESSIRGSFDSDHLRHIHKYAFQDVYAWAGEFRTVPISKGNSFFARPEHIRAELQKLFHQLAGEKYLRHKSDKNFSMVRIRNFFAGLRGAEKGSFEPPDARFGTPFFSHSYEPTLLHKIGECGGKKSTNE